MEIPDDRLLMGGATVPATGRPEPGGHRLLAGVVLLVGLVAISDARFIVRRWAEYGTALRGHYLIGLTAAALLIAVGLRGLIKGLNTVSVLLSAGALLVVGISQILGILTGVIPCGRGPT